MDNDTIKDLGLCPICQKGHIMKGSLGYSCNYFKNMNDKCTFNIYHLRQMPGMLLLNPVSFAEQQDMLRWAVSEYDGPVAIRYPRGSEGSYTASDWKGLETGIVTHRQGKDVTFVTYGVMLDNVLEAAKLLSQQGIEMRRRPR